jgi:hypothetical protein
MEGGGIKEGGRGNEDVIEGKGERSSLEGH